MTRERDVVRGGRVRRTMPLAGFTARAAGGRLVAGLQEKAGDDGALGRFHERTAERYVELLGRSKGVLMKMGQLFSTVEVDFGGDRTLLAYQQALERLQTQSPPMAAELVKAILAEELGRPVAEVFSEFCEDPLSSASIGQVHKAVLRDDRVVAVKIQYPGVAQAIRDDLANSELLYTFLKFTLSIRGRSMASDLRAMADEYAARINEETDYTREAAHLNTFSELFGGHPFIRTPQVIPEACSPRVLTMTFIDGISWTQAQHAEQPLRDSWAEILWRFALTPYGHASLFYPDLHPGNYRFGLDGTLGVVDFGCIKTLPEDLALAWCRLLQALIDEQPGKLHAVMDNIGFFAADATISPEEIYEWMAQLNPDVLGPQPVTYSAELLGQTFPGLDMVGANAMLNRLTVPSDLLFFSRLPLCLRSTITKLRATVQVQSIALDMLGSADPTTALGHQHIAWVRQRGLPFGLQPRTPVHTH